MQTVTAPTVHSILPSTSNICSPNLAAPLMPSMWIVLHAVKSSRGNRVHVACTVYCKHSFVWKRLATPVHRLLSGMPPKHALNAAHPVAVSNPTSLPHRSTLSCVQHSCLPS
jgi:hypothetical protein